MKENRHAERAHTPGKLAAVKRIVQALLLASIALLLPGCSPHDSRQSKASAAAIPTARIKTADDAIAVVRRTIKRNSGDPNGSEYHVTQRGGQWHVMAWRIMYPNNPGAGRFVPGGFTIYTISTEGQIIEIMPGL